VQIGRVANDAALAAWINTTGRDRYVEFIPWNRRPFWAWAPGARANFGAAIAPLPTLPVREVQSPALIEIALDLPDDPPRPWPFRIERTRPALAPIVAPLFTAPPAISLGTWLDLLV